MNWPNALITTGAFASLTVLGVKWIDVSVKRPPPEIQVDTLYSVTYDSTTVISRAADTVRVVVREVGPLTEKMVMEIVCGSIQHDGDGFWFNGLGMVACPHAGLKTE